jgi:tetratricopeptide (TPR) repeat protein
MSPRLALIVCLGTACAACGTPESKAARHIKAGDAFIVQGRNYAAAIEYLNAIKQTPESSVAFRKLGQAHLAAGDAGAAYRSFTKAVDLDPGDVEPRLEAARLLLQAGMHDLAHVRAEQVLERDPENLDAELIAARALAGLRRTDEAVARLSLVSDMKKEARAMVAIAEIKDRADDAAGADRAFKEAIALDPGLAEARTAYAAFLLETDRIDEAEVQLKAAQHSAPDDEVTNRALAALYLATDRPEEAEDYLRRAADRPAQKLKSSIALADFYGSLGRYDDAKTALSRVARAESTDAAAAQVRLAALEYVAGSPEEGRRLLARVLKRHPTSEALALEERFDEAEKIVDSQESGVDSQESGVDSQKSGADSPPR